MVKMNLFDDAVAFSQAHEVNWPREPHDALHAWGVHNTDPPPWNCLLGPVHARGPVSGVVLREGRLVRSWGEADRADLTFSVAKTYLGLLAGVAHARGLLPDPHEPVAKRLPGIGFDSPHNRRVTWAHLFEQTSEWEGSCFGIPDTVDRYRFVSHDPRPAAGVKGAARPLLSPGSFWEYNDVRINQLSLALLHLFQRPLPAVFQESILQPLGANSNFAWQGYDHAWVDLPASGTAGAQRVASVPGGSHWGGGVSISARDQALIGQLMLQDGHWGKAGQSVSLLPAHWLRRMRQPCGLAPFYGWLTWLNPGGSAFPGAGAESFLMVGAGGNYVWVDPLQQTVVVVRWLEPASFAGFVERIQSALAG